MPEAPFARELPGDRGAQRRLGAAEVLHVVELQLVAVRSPSGVVAVLLAALGVEARRLQLCGRVRRDPHVLPGGRDRQGCDALEIGCLVDSRAVGEQVDEPVPGPHAGQPRLEPVDQMQGLGVA